MYGQTEATARMAYLPPLLAETAPATIGIPVAGGSFTIEPLPERPFAGPADPEVGELVYHGPNVMLGYAESPADLALGRTVTELRTGDIGHQREDGLFEVVGRRSRVAKVFGLRLDLDHVEKVLAAAGRRGRGGGRRRPAGARGLLGRRRRRRGRGRRAGPRRARAAAQRPSPGHADRDATAAERQDRLPRGARARGRAGGAGRPPRSTWSRSSVDCCAAPTPPPADTFAGLGGDSLSYVEVSLRLEQPVGSLPADWPQRPLGELGGLGATACGSAAAGSRRGCCCAPPASSRSSAPTPNLFVLAGGAHVLLAVLGFNFARFHLGTERTTRTRHVTRAVARIAVPSALVIATVSPVDPGPGLAAGAAAQRRDRPGHVGRARLALLVHRGRGDADARRDRAARHPVGRPLGSTRRRSGRRTPSACSAC